MLNAERLSVPLVNVTRPVNVEVVVLSLSVNDPLMVVVPVTANVLVVLTVTTPLAFTVRFVPNATAATPVKLMVPSSTTLPLVVIAAGNLMDCVPVIVPVIRTASTLKAAPELFVNPPSMRTLVPVVTELVLNVPAFVIKLVNVFTPALLLSLNVPVAEIVVVPPTVNA